MPPRGRSPWAGDVFSQLRRLVEQRRTVDQARQAMQTVVTSETRAKGPAKFDAVLPQPRTNHGYYRDIAVLAFPTPSAKATIDKLPPSTIGAAIRIRNTAGCKKVPAAAIVARDVLSS